MFGLLFLLFFFFSFFFSFFFLLGLKFSVLPLLFFRSIVLQGTNQDQQKVCMYVKAITSTCGLLLVGILMEIEIIFRVAIKVFE